MPDEANDFISFLNPFTSCALRFTHTLTEMSNRGRNKVCLWAGERGQCVKLATSPPSVSRLSRQCKIFSISKPYRPVRGILCYFLRYILQFFSRSRVLAFGGRTELCLSSVVIVAQRQFSVQDRVWLTFLSALRLHRITKKIVQNQKLYFLAFSWLNVQLIVG
jgi:hypothetical protein